MIRKIILSILIACILCTSVFASSTTFNITAYKKKTTLDPGVTDGVQLELLDAMSAQLNPIYDNSGTVGNNKINITEHLDLLLGNISDRDIYLLGKRSVFSYSIYGYYTGTYRLIFTFGAEGEGFKKEGSTDVINTAFGLNNFSYNFTGSKNVTVDTTNYSATLTNNIGTSSESFIIKHNGNPNTMSDTEGILIGDTSTATTIDNTIYAEFSVSKDGSTTSSKLPDNTLWLAKGVIPMVIELNEYQNAPAGKYTMNVNVKLEVL